MACSVPIEIASKYSYI